MKIKIIVFSVNKYFDRFYHPTKIIFHFHEVNPLQPAEVLKSLSAAGAPRGSREGAARVPRGILLSKLYD